MTLYLQWCWYILEDDMPDFTIDWNFYRIGIDWESSPKGLTEPVSEWCRENFGYVPYVHTHYAICDEDCTATVFMFNSDADMIHFKLRWS